MFLPGKRKKNDEGWWFELRLPDATIDVAEGRPWQIQATTELRMRDTDPLIAMLREGSEAPAWLGLIPNVKNVHGKMTMEMGPGGVSMEHIDISGKKTEVRGFLNFGKGGTDGLLFIKYTIFSAGIEFLEGEKKFKLMNSLKWFEERLVERESEAAESQIVDEAPVGVR